MMHQKAILFGDLDCAKKIMTASNPKEQKAIGRRISGFDEPTWLNHQMGIVMNANMLKFTQSDKHLRFILSTENKTIIEASPFDTIWGVGLSENDPDILDTSKWKGKNLLGITLVHVRSLLNLVPAK